MVLVLQKFFAYVEIGSLHGNAIASAGKIIAFWDGSSVGFISRPSFRDAPEAQARNP
jgi:hypothetical protein